MEYRLFHARLLRSTRLLRGFESYGFLGVFVVLTCMVSLFTGSVAGAAAWPDLVPLVKRLKPVVVNISSTIHTSAKSKLGLAPDGLGNQPLDEFFRRFFEQMPQESFKSRSLGSGVIIDSSGYILTNNHVIEDADDIQVRLPDEREFAAKVVGKDSKTDLALIRIEGAGTLPVAIMGDSDKAEVGSWVVAIGNPFGLDTTVTVGIISAKGRIIGNGPYDNFLQTDAAINPGNSGGPLFNMNGEVIGINTAIFSRSGGNMGIGFATPVNMAKTVLKQLKSQGHVTRGWLGVRIQSVTQELVQALGLEKRHGALVASVEAGSPAQLAGIKTGDVIVNFDGHSVNHMNELPAIVAETPVDKKVRVDIVRAGKPLLLDVVIAKMQDKAVDVVADNGEASSFGVTVRSITADLREQLELDAEVQGVVVAGVEVGSSASAAGLQIKDVITEINREPIGDTADFHRTVKNIKSGDTLLVLLLRGGDPLYIAVQVAEKKKK